VGLSVAQSGSEPYAEAAERAASELGDLPVDAALVFASAVSLPFASEGMAAVTARLRPAALAGCAAQGVVAEGKEVELGGVAVWAASLGAGSAEAFSLEAVPTGEGTMAVTGVPDLDAVDGVVALVDPFSFPVEPLLRELSADHPGLPVIGGLASARTASGTLLGPDGISGVGVTGLTFSGVKVAACVSQGARPVGPEMAITAAEGNVIHELAGKPAVERLREAVEELPPEERELAVEGLLLGLVVDPNKPDYRRGDFLVRGVLAADAESGAVTLGEFVRVGQTVQLQVRDAASAGADLAAALGDGLADLGCEPAGALLFTCNGRGSHMFDVPDHDATTVAAAAGGVPAAGFFCAGEIGPVGNRNFVHGFTATLALFAAASPASME
jgi:small ligand-binding sensory domain FIST